ncbi:AraC family transcriptional regulator [Fodinibius salsisoli]|uniref:Helix-turn-helix domain-containing protein n=1 Tax=Fodinibius salsisoli TaxID=2820877 RepID=A0ABT3PI06_9BACT|nr:AraC family transcriptional regulator [Fodinibius salsisoli]MCW9705561.1 helix-turn-helix domain-containing protein [Fodinibius salsisoli]
MKRVIFQPVKIESYKTDYIECPPQSNAFFELVFVETGSGSRTVGNYSIPFEAGDLFLHLPSEKNAITLNEYSVLHFIKLQKAFFDKNRQDVLEITEWFSNIEFILSGNHHQKPNIITIDKDRDTIQSLFDVILDEEDRSGKFSSLNLKALLFTLLNIVARNILNEQSTNQQAQEKSDKSTDLLNYINYHILDSDKMSVTHLSEQFAISPNYFSEYFRKNFGTSFKQYVLTYKLKLAESKLKYTNLTISEIAAQLGFTDVSHLNKTFQKYQDRLPSEIV